MECEKRFVQGDPQLVDLLKKFSKSLEYIRKLTLIFRRGIHYPAFYWFCVAKSELFEKWAFFNTIQLEIFWFDKKQNTSLYKFAKDLGYFRLLFQKFYYKTFYNLTLIHDKVWAENVSLYRTVLVIRNFETHLYVDVYKVLRLVKN